MSYTPSAINVARVPLPPRVVDREAIVDQLASETGRCGALWLHGSSGLGKTVLSLFIARKTQRDWFIVELRGCSGSELEYRLRTALMAINTRGFGGVILDDFPLEYASNGRIRLSILAGEIQRMDGALVVTASRPLSPNLEGCFGESGVHVRDVPYLTKEDVAVLVESAGGDSDEWASVIHTFCGFGHPQLVDARIRGLDRRGWPKTELLAGIDPIGAPAKEVDEERAAIRVRLIAELPEDARELLYRLTLVVGSFDRILAISIGQVSPVVPRPGEAFDFLLGPWVEARADDRFGVSPLVSDAGTKNLAKETQSSVHRQIVDQLITRKPFPADFLGQLLSHALLSRHEAGLTWLSMAVFSTKDEDRRKVSEQLFLLPLFDTYDNKPLFPENAHVSAMLRFTQFQVAVATNVTDRLERIVERLIAEARMIEHDDASKGFLLIAISTALMERSLPIRPSKWMSLLAEFQDLLSGDSEIAKFARNLEPLKEGLENWTPGQFMFVCRATALKGIDELVELFKHLNSLEVPHRNDLLSALRDPYTGARLMIHSAWLADHYRVEIDGVRTAESFKHLAEIAQRWGHPTIAVECEVAQAVMLDEYGQDPDAALAALTDAEKRFPGDVRIARQRAKVHYRKDDYNAALKDFTHVADALPADDTIERAFALREAGISASETDDLLKARRFFGEACEAASRAGDNMLPMAVGLKADCAVAEFQMENYEEALRLMAQALRDGDEINPEAGPKEKYCALILGHVILWMRSQVQGSEWLGQDMAIVAGGCSQPEPPEEIMERTTPPKLLRWYLLAELEAELGINIGMIEELRKRTAGNEVISYESSLSISLMARKIISVDIDGFCSYLPEFVSQIAFMINERESLHTEDSFNPKIGVVQLLEVEDWSRKPYLDLAQNAILAIQASAVCSGQGDIRDEIGVCVDDIKGSSSVLRPFLECFDGDLSASRDNQEIAAACIGRLLDADNPLSPDELFWISCCLVNWLAFSVFKSQLGPVLADFLGGQWREVIQIRRFMLKQPMRTVPFIQAALESSHKGVAKMAAIVLAAEDAVHHRLTSEIRELLKKSAGSTGSES